MFVLETSKEGYSYLGQDHYFFKIVKIQMFNGMFVFVVKWMVQDNF